MTGKLKKQSLTPAISFAVQLRMLFIVLSFAAMFGFVLHAAWKIQIGKHEAMTKRASNQHVKEVEIPSPRGRILDRRGRVLAITGEGLSVVGRPKEAKDITTTAKILHEILGKPAGDIEYRLAANRHFVWIARHISQEQAERIKKRNLSGVEIAKEPRRYYPMGSLASHVLGFGNIDGVGLAGVERLKNEKLQGTKKVLPAIRDGRGRMLLPVFDENLGNGEDVKLTIDAVIQEQVEMALEQGVLTNKAKSGAAIVLSPHSGEVLAIANYPTFDSNVDRGDLDKMRNRVVADNFEIGSVMKPLIMAGALERGVIAPDQEFDLHNGKFEYAGKVFKDTYKDGVSGLSDIIKRSSNIGMIQVATRLGKKGMVAVIKDFGFGQKPGLGISGESRGRTLALKRMSNLDLATASFGYGGTMATPLQVATAYSAIANGGELLVPTLFSDGTKSSRKRIVSTANAKLLRGYMKTVFDRGAHRGSAASVIVDGYDAAGKTGTARKVDPSTRQYSDKLHVASFAGFAPAEDPRVVVVVMIDEPGGKSHSGSSVAGPIFASIVENSLRYLQVAGKDTSTTSIHQAKELEKIDAIDVEEVPVSETPTAFCAGVDFSELPLGAALNLAGEHGLTVETRGVGRVISAKTLVGGCELTFGNW